MSRTLQGYYATMTVSSFSPARDGAVSLRCKRSFIKIFTRSSFPLFISTQIRGSGLIHLFLTSDWEWYPAFATSWSRDNAWVSILMRRLPTLTSYLILINALLHHLRSTLRCKFGLMLVVGFIEKKLYNA